MDYDIHFKSRKDGKYTFQGTTKSLEDAVRIYGADLPAHHEMVVTYNQPCSIVYTNIDEAQPGVIMRW